MSYRRKINFNKKAHSIIIENIKKHKRNSVPHSSKELNALKVRKRFIKYRKWYQALPNNHWWTLEKNLHVEQRQYWIEKGVGVKDKHIKQGEVI